jgi:hypothetical protein
MKSATGNAAVTTGILTDRQVIAGLIPKQRLEEQRLRLAR